VPAVALLAIGACGRIAEPPSRDTDTEPYLTFVNRVPSFWVEEEGGEVTIPFYVHDDELPSGVEAELLQEIVAGALDSWREPLDAAGRNVDLPLIYASSGQPEPVRGVHVYYVTRGEYWLGATDYLGDRVEVRVSVKELNLDRFLPRRKVFALMLHELGHALGISQPGHSPNPNDVMYGHDLESSWVTLSQGDRSTLLALFP
jgi:hypothetical protein